MPRISPSRGTAASNARLIPSISSQSVILARSERSFQGKVPLHTLRADVDYAITEAATTAGVIGVKVWIYRGEILPEKSGELVGAERA